LGDTSIDYAQAGFGGQSILADALCHIESTFSPPRVKAAWSRSDRGEIESLVARYVTALDTLDADTYANVFTEDAELKVGSERILPKGGRPARCCAWVSYIEFN